MSASHPTQLPLEHTSPEGQPWLHAPLPPVPLPPVPPWPPPLPPVPILPLPPVPVWPPPLPPVPTWPPCPLELPPAPELDAAAEGARRHLLPRARPRGGRRGRRGSAETPSSSGASSRWTRRPRGAWRRPGPRQQARPPPQRGGRRGRRDEHGDQRLGHVGSRLAEGARDRGEDGRGPAVAEGGEQTHLLFGRPGSGIAVIAVFSGCSILPAVASVPAVRRAARRSAASSSRRIRRDAHRLGARVLHQREGRESVDARGDGGRGRRAGSWASRPSSSIAPARPGAARASVTGLRPPRSQASAIEAGMASGRCRKSAARRAGSVGSARPSWEPRARLGRRRRLAGPHARAGSGGDPRPARPPPTRRAHHRGSARGSAAGDAWVRCNFAGLYCRIVFY